MSITAVFVLFSMIWFLVLFLSLQINITTQGDTGDVVHGTHASSPEGFSLKKRVLVTTAISVPLCALVVFTILSGVITLDMFEFYNLIEK
jgi:predicted secreted protein